MSILVLIVAGLTGVLAEERLVEYVPELSTSVPELFSSNTRTLVGTVTPARTFSVTNTVVPEFYMVIPELRTSVPELFLIETAAPTKVLVHVKTGITGGYLNIRSGAGINYPVVFVAAEMMELEFVSCANGWIEVRLSNIVGFAISVAIDGSDDLCRKNK